MVKDRTKKGNDSIQNSLSSQGDSLIITKERFSSSNITLIIYDASIQELTVGFHNGSMYQYKISNEEFIAFKKSESKGEYFAKNIKEKPFVKIK